MPHFPSPRTIQELGLHPERWDRILDLCRTMSTDGTVPALAVDFVRGDGCLERPLLYGRQLLADESGTIRDDAIFLVASLTKPFVAMATMLLVDQGKLSLNERVRDLIPEMDDTPKRPMTVRHLLTHTSGLPDMLPNNRQLREQQSPFQKFLEGTLAVTLDFPPGYGVQYQSMGFVLLSEMIFRISGQRCSDFLRQKIFEPLGMHDTSLGAPDSWFGSGSPVVDRIVEVAVPEDQQEETDWNWNSRYWRQFGAPWGGLLTTPRDLAKWAVMMLNNGRAGDIDLFSPATIAAATTNQLHDFREVPEADRRARGWGFGWRMNWSAHVASCGDLLSKSAYGHWGATGTMLWIDPERNAAAVILSTQPFEHSGGHLSRLSNAITAAIV
ncbi:MAG: beta-lactamase family protein [Planctomycetaceae bacterium]|nr:beta-lactamase family protein [Planctomycetaceae bacterium]